MKITKQFNFSAGHTLHDYQGLCYNLHGHNYRLLVTVASPRLTPQGMVMDFGQLKQVIQQLLDQDYDHRVFVYRADPRSEKLLLIDPNVV